MTGATAHGLPTGMAQGVPAASVHAEPAAHGASAPPGVEPLAAVQALGAGGAAAADPVGWAILQALARRAEAQQEGPARQELLRRVDARLTGLVAQMALTTSAPRVAPAQAALPGLAALSELIDRLGRTSVLPIAPPTPPAPLPAPPRAGPARPGTARGGASQAGPAQRPAPPARAATPSPLKAVAAYQGTWSRLRAEQRLRQALAQVPAKAGPLNSSQIVHRALQTLQALSPAYLDAFMAQVDTLLWLEQASGGDTLPPRQRKG